MFAKYFILASSALADWRSPVKRRRGRHENILQWEHKKKKNAVVISSQQARQEKRTVRAEGMRERKMLWQDTLPLFSAMFICSVKSFSLSGEASNRKAWLLIFSPKQARTYCCLMWTGVSRLTSHWLANWVDLGLAPGLSQRLVDLHDFHEQLGVSGHVGPLLQVHAIELQLKSINKGLITGHTLITHCS